MTGLALITGSWMVTKTVWLTILMALPIGVWWIYFLLLWPRLIRLSEFPSNEEKSTPDSTSQVGK